MVENKKPDKRFPIPETGRGSMRPPKDKPQNSLLQPGPKPEGDTSTIKRQWDVIWQNFHEWWSAHPTASWPTQRNKVEELVERQMAFIKLKNHPRVKPFIDVLTNPEIVTLITEGVNRLPDDCLKDLIVKLNVLIETKKGEQTDEPDQS